MNEHNCELLNFIAQAKSPFHAVSAIERMLEMAGYSRLYENENWALTCGQRYYLKKNDSSLIAFKVPKGECKSFLISASHSDSPSFKLKPNFEKKGGGDSTVLSVERYGGGLLSTWFDRPLSVAGRAVISENGQIKTRLFSIEKDLCIIPSVAIHFNRNANDGVKIQPNIDTFPLLGISANTRLEDEIKSAVGCENILSTDAFLYVRQEGSVLGIDDEFICAPKLDDLMCAFGCTKGFLFSDECESIPVLCVFDNEEVGSATKQGAASSFLRDTLYRISDSLGFDNEKAKQMLSQSFMVSADNAHAIHPNHPEFSDLDNAPKINGGVVIKHNANQKYTTDAVSSGIFKAICNKAGVLVQNYANRADMPGGSTLGSIADTMVPIMTVDIGLAQLAMHSAFETAGSQDIEYLIDAMTAFYSTTITKDQENIVLG